MSDDSHNIGRSLQFLGELTRITTTRVVVQAVAFLMFLAFVTLTSFANLDRFPGLRMWVGKFLEIDPLIAVATAVSTHAVYRGLLWSLVILIPTLFLGRFFCSWICPYGTLHHLVGWAFNRRSAEQSVHSNRYRESYRIKYLVLVALIVAAALGTLQIGLVDPLCMMYRSLTGSVLPAADMATRHVWGSPKYYDGSLLIGAVLFTLVALNLVIPRFFCRVLCPLGALLGLLSRFSWWRIARDSAKCQACHQCVAHCEGACSPDDQLRLSECLVCFNCLDDCPHGALRFAFLPSAERVVIGIDVPRRRLILGALAGALFYPFARTSPKELRNQSGSTLLRPPGATPEPSFLERCIKCDQCARVCPTNVIQPAWTEAGFEGLWTPALDFRIGHCQLHCTACGQVCPTGAIQRVSVERKLGLGQYADVGPLRLGTAHLDVGRCLPHSRGIPCVVCEEVCPTSPKAVYGERRVIPLHNGQSVVQTATDHSLTIARQSAVANLPAELPRIPSATPLGDDAADCCVVVEHNSGLTETRQLLNAEGNTLVIRGHFARIPTPGTAIRLCTEVTVPRIDPSRCIGCGLCEYSCPAGGRMRAIYVTADGETRANPLEFARNLLPIG